MLLQYFQTTVNLSPQPNSSQTKEEQNLISSQINKGLNELINIFMFTQAIYSNADKIRH